MFWRGFLKYQILFCLLTFCSGVLLCQQDGKPYAIVIHGGAGGYSPEAKVNQEYKKVIEQALLVGYSILEQGGTAIDAVEKAINVLEASPLFNAGVGSVLNEEGFVEMDASIMEGKDLRAGAVAGVRNYKYPISLARLIMEKTPHLLFAGSGVEKLIDSFKLERISPDSLITPQRKKEYLEKYGKSKGTVGAVALDKYGNIAAGTSTGGMFGKMVGRVGDSPIIGAGTYANNSTCGISCTGWGEYFIRQSAAFQVSALMELANYSLQKAIETVLLKIKKMGATGGMIGIDRLGNVAFDYTTEGMPCGFMKSNGEKMIIIFKEELNKK
jgi:beta-aspartyl-peptidase (threonine type)